MVYRTSRHRIHTPTHHPSSQPTAAAGRTRTQQTAASAQNAGGMGDCGGQLRMARSSLHTANTPSNQQNRPAMLQFGVVGEILKLWVCMCGNRTNEKVELDSNL